MLVLSRREGERIQIDGSATIVVTRIANNRVCLGIEADPSVRILRGELTDSTPPSAADMEAKPVLQQMASV